MKVNKITTIFIIYPKRNGDNEANNDKIAQNFVL